MQISKPGGEYINHLKMVTWHIDTPLLCVQGIAVDFTYVLHL